jgi:hypothetical protein
MTKDQLSKIVTIITVTINRLNKYSKKGEIVRMELKKKKDLAKCGRVRNKKKVGGKACPSTMAKYDRQKVSAELADQGDLEKKVPPERKRDNS